MRAPSDFAVPYKFSHLWFRFRTFLMTFIPVIMHLKGLNFCEQEFQKFRRFLISQYFSKKKFYTDENLELFWMFVTNNTSREARRRYLFIVS